MGLAVEQLRFFEESEVLPLIVKDSECNIGTPIRLGMKDTRIYGTGHIIKPRIPGKCSTPHQKKFYLPELLPLEEYNKIIILFSGGKDSAACFFKL